VRIKDMSAFAFDYSTDEVTHVLQRAAENAAFTVARHPRAVRRLRRTMDLFAEGMAAYETARARHPRPDIRFGRHDPALTFFAAARRSLLCGTKLTFEHELTDAAKPLRGAIEAALAGCHVVSDPTAWDRWRNRPAATRWRSGQEDSARLARREISTEFGVGRLAAELRKRHPSLASTSFALYEELIDLGGHFNNTALPLTTIHPDSTDLPRALCRANRTAVTCLRIFDLIFAEVLRDRSLSERIRAAGSR